jgi:hypothetical protein
MPSEPERTSALGWSAAMTPTKLLIGQILIVFAIVILGVWAATQWAAAMLGYQPELGAPFVIIGHLPIYLPWSIFPWWYQFDAYAPHVFDKAGTLAATSGMRGGDWRLALAGKASAAGNHLRLCTLG